MAVHWPRTKLLFIVASERRPYISGIESISTIDRSDLFIVERIVHVQRKTRNEIAMLEKIIEETVMFSNGSEIVAVVFTCQPILSNFINGKSN